MNKNIEAVQWLRGLAALLVVAYHTEYAVQKLSIKLNIPWDHIVIPGRFGVDIFFIISGFIMMYISRDKFAKPGEIGQFLKRRFIRIVPLYWVYTAAMLGVLAIIPAQTDSFSGMPDTFYIISSFLFIPAEKADGSIVPLLNVGWTINYEIYFYLLFCAALAFPRKVSIPVLLAFLVISGAAGQLLDLQDIAYFYGRPVIWEFAIGILLALAYMRGWTLPAFTIIPVIPAVIVLALAGDAEGDLLRVAYSATAATALVACSILIPFDRRSRPLSRLGDVSYSLYLSHMFVIGIASFLWMALDIQSLWLFMATVPAACIISGYVAYIALEKPILNILSK